jgi:hypothetical protein
MIRTDPGQCTRPRLPPLAACPAHVLTPPLAACPAHGLTPAAGRMPGPRDRDVT